MTRSLATCCLAIGLVFAGLRVVADEPPGQTSPNEKPLAGTAPPARFYAGFSGYTRRVTCSSAEAQRWFDQGLQLLYGYNHDEAIRSFEMAAAIDSSCAIRDSVGQQSVSDAPCPNHPAHQLPLLGRGLQATFAAFGSGPVGSDRLTSVPYVT